MKRVFVLCLVFVLAAAAYSIKPLKEYRFYPQEIGLIYKRLKVVTSDNYNIETWFFPAQPTAEEKVYGKELIDYKLIDNKPRTTLIICNGDSGNMSYYQMYLVQQYTSKGFNVVTFDWRDFGDSQPFPMNTDYMCYTEMLYDYDAVIKTVAKQKEVDRNRIYLMGWSTGGYLSMIAAHDNKLVRGVMLRAIPTSFEEVIPILKQVLGKKESNLIVPRDFPRSYMPLYIAPHFSKSIYLIVGELDNRTPVWMLEKIFAALPKSINKKLTIIPGAEHGGERAPEVVDSPRFIKETVDFMLQK